MATITTTYPTSKAPTRFPFGWLLLAGLAVIAWNFAALRIANAALSAEAVMQQKEGTAYDHSLPRHKEGAVAALRCFDNYGHSAMTYNWWKDSFVQLCQDETGQVFYKVLRIIKGHVERISAYPKNQCFSLDEGLQILLDQGAEIRWIKPGVAVLEYFRGMIGR